MIPSSIVSGDGVSDGVSLPGRRAIRGCVCRQAEPAPLSQQCSAAAVRRHRDSLQCAAGDWSLASGRSL